MKKHYDDVREGITQIKPTINQSAKNVTRKDGYTSIDKGKANFILTAMKKKS